MIRDPFGFRFSEPLSEPKPHILHQIDLRRIYSAVVFVPLFFLFVRYGPPVLFFFLISVISLLALWEFFQMFFPSPSHQMLRLTGLGLMIALLAAIEWREISSLVSALTILVFAVVMAFMIRFTQQKPALPSFLVYPLGVFYIGLGLGHFLLLRNLVDGDLIVFFVILVTWSADTAAYFVGISMGRRQLAPRLSPKKTVEGFAGGVLVAVFVAIISHLTFLPFLTLLECVIIGVLLASLGLLGDLAESSFKRRSGVKDSGSLIPGHGGVLDRLDSLLFTGPAFYYYMLFTSQAGG